jgi:hypothetical protein
VLKFLPHDLRFTTRRQFPRNIPDRAAFDAAVDTYVMDGLTPDAPFLSQRSRIITMGSCFAQNIARLLGEQGYTVHRFDVQERLFTPMALKAFIEGLAADDVDFAPFEDEVPPLKWSILRYVFPKEDHDGQKEAYT